MTLHVTLSVPTRAIASPTCSYLAWSDAANSGPVIADASRSGSSTSGQVYIYMIDAAMSHAIWTENHPTVLTISAAIAQDMMWGALKCSPKLAASASSISTHLPATHYGWQINASCASMFDMKSVTVPLRRKLNLVENILYASANRSYKWSCSSQRLAVLLHEFFLTNWMFATSSWTRFQIFRATGSKPTYATMLWQA